MASRHSIRFSLTHEHLLACLHYDPETGVFTWRHRPASTFEDGPKRSAEWKANCWNSRRAGHPAGSINCSGNGTYYIRIAFGPIAYYAQRLAWFYMKGEWPTGLIDHRNGDGLQNRWLNLRHSDPSGNAANRAEGANNKLGIKGVYRAKCGKRFCAAINKDGRQCHLGTFDTAKEARAAYIGAAQVLFGVFARQRKDDDDRSQQDKDFATQH